MSEFQAGDNWTCPICGEHTTIEHHISNAIGPYCDDEFEPEIIWDRDRTMVLRAKDGKLYMAEFAPYYDMMECTSFEVVTPDDVEMAIGPMVAAAQTRVNNMLRELAELSDNMRRSL